MRTLEKIQDQLSPRNKLHIEQKLQRRLPRVDSMKQVAPSSQPEQRHPRVQFEEPRDAGRLPTRMIVASPREQVVNSPQKPLAKPKPILKAPTHTVQEDSIAARIKARRAMQSTAPNVAKADDKSIAERLLHRKRQMNQVHAAFPVLDPETGQLLEYRQLLRHPKFKEAWSISAANEFGRLAQGIKGRVKATDTLKFIRRSEIPADRLKDVTNIKFVCQVQTEKDEPNPTFGGNLIHYPNDVGTPTADLLLIKIFLNSVISTPGARYATADLSNFYLCTPMPRPEFGRVKLGDIPEEIIDEYKLHLDHLMGVLKRHYDVSVDIQGKEFVKIELDWDYKKGERHLSMEPYLQKALRQFNNLVPKKRQDSLTRILNQNMVQKSNSPNTTTDLQLEKKDKHMFRRSMENFYVDPTTLVPLSALASQQSKPTQNTLDKSQHFLDYMATQEPAVLTY
eukprot:CCRYP_014613-RA/>CCRYP_014613-RA protein AED:0.37 eAED:0.37 QI:0/0/0/1/0/0/4/0/451